MRAPAKVHRRKPAKPPLFRGKCLYLEADNSIVDENKNPVTLEEAKALWEAGTLDDYNLSFRRLAMLNWDFEALKAYYAQGGRA